jgi:hypothetical protein
VRLEKEETAKGSHKARMLVFAVARYKVASGKTKLLKLDLRRRARIDLAQSKHGRLALTATASVTGGHRLRARVVLHLHRKR